MNPDANANRAHALGQCRFDDVHRGPAAAAVEVTADSYSSHTSRCINSARSESQQNSLNQNSLSTTVSGDTIPISQTEFEALLNQNRAVYQSFREPPIRRLTGPRSISQSFNQDSETSGGSQRMRLFSTLRDSTQSIGRRQHESNTTLNDMDHICLVDDDTINGTNSSSNSSPVRDESSLKSQHTNYRMTTHTEFAAHSLQTPNPTAVAENPFAGKLAPVLPLSQVFDASSPGSGLLRSEVSDLPSPNIPISLNPTLDYDDSSPILKNSPATRSFPGVLRSQLQRLPSKLSRNICRRSDDDRQEAVRNEKSNDSDDDGPIAQDNLIRQRLQRRDSLNGKYQHFSKHLRSGTLQRTRSDIFPFATFPAPTRDTGRQRGARQRQRPMQLIGESEEETEPDETASQRRARAQSRFRIFSGEEDKENFLDELIPITNSSIRTRNVFSQPPSINNSPSIRRRQFTHFTDSYGVSQSQPIIRTLDSLDDNETARGQKFPMPTDGGSRVNSPDAQRTQVPCSQSEDETEPEDKTPGNTSQLQATVSRRASLQARRTRHLSPDEDDDTEDKENRYSSQTTVSPSQATVRAHEALSQILQTGSGDDENGRHEDEEKSGDAYVLRIHEDEDEHKLNSRSNSSPCQPVMKRGNNIDHDDEQSGSQSSRRPLSQIGGSSGGLLAHAMVVPPSDTEDDREVDNRHSPSKAHKSQTPVMDEIYNDAVEEEGADENTPPLKEAYQTPAARLTHQDDLPSTIPETSPARLRAFMTDSRQDTPIIHENYDETHQDEYAGVQSNEEDSNAQFYMPADHRRYRPKFKSPDPFSSPSGRRRQRLTEIALDGSQSQGQPLPDLSGLGVFNEDDLEFQSLVRRRSPIKPSYASKRLARTGFGRSASFAGMPIAREHYPRRKRDEDVMSESGVRSMQGLQSTPTPPESPPSNYTVQLQNHKKRRVSDGVDAGHKYLDYHDHEPPKKRTKSIPQRQTGGTESENVCDRQEHETHNPEPSQVSQRAVPDSQHKSDSSSSGALSPGRALSDSSPSPEEYTPTTPEHSSEARQKTSKSESPDPLAADDTISTPILTQTVRGTMSQFTHPHQVFAFFNGRPQGFYPAICVGVTQKYGHRRYLVKFEGSTRADEVGEDGIKRLELRSGDHVKLDLVDMPKGGWTVLGCPRRLSGRGSDSAYEDTTDGMMTDVFGHETVVLEHKTSTSTQTVTVPINHVWFDRQLWKKIEGRDYIHTESYSASSQRFQTPVDYHYTPTISTSRASRGSRATTTSTGGIFSNMAFAVSMKDGGTNRFLIEKMIRTNGGRILQEGFNELFHVSRNSETEEDSDLRLLPDFEQLGFVGLITDEHSRRVKYMQALALNIPCLAFRWVKDCIDKDCLLDWDAYLLPAGESKFLGGAVKSRILLPYPASTARFSRTVEQGHKLLAGQSVIFLAAKGKAAEARRAYAFLIYAMGAKSVTQVQDINAAIRLLKQSSEGSGWDWIYVGDESSAPGAYSALSDEFGLNNRSLSRGTGSKAIVQKQQLKKRGRKSGVDTDATNCPSFTADEPIVINGKRLRVLANDFICQSLILGKLYPEHC